MSSIQKSSLLGLCGLAAGVVNGLLGAGSGVLIVFALQAALRGSEADSRDVFANATAVILPISLVSAVLYFRAGQLPEVEWGRYLLPGVLGGLAGAWLLGKLPARAVKCTFSLVVLLSGMIMLVR